MKAQLLCTFANIDAVMGTIKLVKKTYEEVTEITVFSYTSTPNNIICVYNVLDKSKRLKDTISINKKKETNTYYSINALNALIMAMNNGVLDKSYRITWNDYKDSILLSNGPAGYRHILLQQVGIF